MAKGTKTAGARASMLNVAAYAGVSIATVSKVMKGVSTVLPENVVKVQNAIEALGYRINPLGAELRRGRRNLIGVIVPTLEAPAIASLLTMLEDAVEARHYVLFIASSRRSEAREADLVNRMHDWRVAGVVVVPVKGQASPGALLLEDSGLPAVYIQRLRGAARFDTVSPDYDLLTQEIAAELRSMGRAELMVPKDDVFANGFWSESLLKTLRQSGGGSITFSRSEAHSSDLRVVLASQERGGDQFARVVPLEAIAHRSLELLFDRMEHAEAPRIMETRPFVS